jgi:hypothetical protein
VYLRAPECRGDNLGDSLSAFFRQRSIHYLDTQEMIILHWMKLLKFYAHAGMCHPLLFPISEARGRARILTDDLFSGLPPVSSDQVSRRMGSHTEWEPHLDDFCSAQAQ